MTPHTLDVDSYITRKIPFSSQRKEMMAVSVSKHKPSRLLCCIDTNKISITRNVVYDDMAYRLFKQY